jgi:ubiquinone/menaquinone biosynthesis C-methylase UbiE
MSTNALTTTEIREVYRKRAPRYDLTSRLYGLLGYRLDTYRRRGVEALDLQQGDTVVELGCGTGANFEALEAAIGPAGTLIGVDLSPQMLEQARERIDRKGWRNVTLVESDVARYELPEKVDGIVSTFALMLLPSYDDVIRRGAEALAPGGRFVVVDIKAPRSWPEGLLRAVVTLLVRPFGVTLDLRSRHLWESLAQHLSLVLMEERYLGTTYIAAGEKPAASPTDKGEVRP